MMKYRFDVVIYFWYLFLVLFQQSIIGMNFITYALSQREAQRPAPRPNAGHNPTGLTPNIKIKTALTPVGVDAIVVPGFIMLFAVVTPLAELTAL